MDVHRSITSALQIFVVFTYFAAAFFFLGLPFLPETCLELSDLLLHKTDALAPVAIVLFISAFLLLIGFYSSNRGRVLYVEMGTHTASIEEGLIRHSLEECFKIHFPQKMQLSDVEILWGKKLQIAISLQNPGEPPAKDFLMAVERHLQLFLRQRFGYIKPFYLILKSN